MVKLSIIVPIYNVEKYLQKCLDSIMNQTIQEFEVILINDGSTDLSIEIAQRFVESDNRFKLINKDNTGVSSTRNEGISTAVGEYIAFIDSDDWIEKGMFEKLYNLATEYNCEVVGCNYKCCDEIRSSFNKYPLDEGIYINKSVIKDKILSKVIDGKLKTPIWDKIYKREFLNINNIKFDSKINIFEDWYFIIEVYEKMESFYFLNENLYNYRISVESLSNKYYDNFFEMIEQLHKRKLEFMKDNLLYSDENIKVSKFNYLNDINKIIFLFLSIYLRIKV